MEISILLAAIVLNKGVHWKFTLEMMVEEKGQERGREAGKLPM